MIPFTTSVVYGKVVTPWRDLTNQDENIDDVQPKRNVISVEKRDSNSLYIRMLGNVLRAEEITQSAMTVSQSQDQTRECLMDGDMRPMLRERFFSMNRSRHKHQPLNILSPLNAMLFDESYSSQAQCLLNKVGRWNFNIFQLDQLTNGRPVFTIAMHLFQHYNLINHFQLEIDKVVRCFRRALNNRQLKELLSEMENHSVVALVSPLDILVTLLAAMSHDIDHPGVNNSFLIATSNHLATLYMNMSVLENHHWRTAIGLIQQTQILHHFSLQQWESFCMQMKTLIMATDIARQQEFVSTFRTCLDDQSIALGSVEDFSGIIPKYLTLQIALKCSDISNTCREWAVSKHWSDRVCDEFFKQGDCELMLNLPVTPMCDRTLTTTPNIQIGFMQYVVQPLFHEWQRFCPSGLSELMIGNLNRNIQHWKQWGRDRNIPLDDASSDECSSASSLHDLISSLTPLGTDEKVAITQYHSVVLAESGTMSPGRSLSPVSEDLPSELISAISKRRHSMPIGAIRKEHTRLMIRRESFPRSNSRRRYSLPRTGVTSSTSYDQIVGKLHLLETGVGKRTARSASLEVLCGRPNLSNLSPNPETSDILSHLTGYQTWRSVPCKATHQIDAVHLLKPSLDIEINIDGNGESSTVNTRRRASLPVLETAREYLTRQLVDVATLFSCLEPSSKSYERTLAAASFYSNGHSVPASCRSRSNSMFEMTQNQLSHMALLQECSK